MRILTADNGLRVLFRPMKTNIVDMRYFINVGAMDEKPEHEGYCHALEHMLFAGSEARDWEQLIRAYEQLGAYSNAWTWHDRTIYAVNCLKTAWEPCLEIMAEMLYNPLFPEERWETIEKPAIVSEIQGYEDDADWLLNEEMYISALGERYHPIVGSVDNIREATMDGLRYFYDEYYTGDNIILCIAGNLTEKQVLKAVNKYDRRPDRTPPKPEKLDFDFNYDTVDVLKQDLEQAHIRLLKPLAIPKTQKGKAALDLAVSLVGEHLHEELREKRGLCYHAGAAVYHEIPDHYYLDVITATDDDRFEETKEAISEALENMDQCFKKDRIQNAIRFEKYNTTGASERAEIATNWMWDAYAEGIEEDPFEFHLDILEGMSDSYVRKLAKRSFQGEMKFGKIIEEADNGFWSNLRRRIGL